MPGDLWTGYLQAQAADVAEVEREEDKKKQRLQEQLQKLDMESLRRGMERDAREWEIEDAARTGREEMLSRLQELIKGGDTLGAEQWFLGQQLGIDLSGLEDFTQEQYIPTGEELRDEYLIKTKQKPEVKTPGAGGQDKWEYIKSLTAKDPADLTEEEERYLIGQGLRYDEKLRAWAKPKAGGTDDWTPYEKSVGIRFGDSGGEGGEIPVGADGGKQINYEGLAKGLRAEHGIKTKQTLEAFKNELLQLYPGLKWEELKVHFK